MSTYRTLPVRLLPAVATRWTLVAAFRPLQALMAWPSALFLTTLTVMLFRPPDIQFYWLDRIAFLLLVFVIGLRVLALRQPLCFGRLTWPMLGLLFLAFGSALARPYEAQTWSIFAAKWLVPFALFHLAQYVFDDEASLRNFEVFSLIVLAYLSAIAVLFLFGAPSLIFPRYILNEGIGIHADRARGPFLQAVANGVTLNLLGLIALDLFRRRRLHGVFALSFAIAVPLAILATKTRAVWLSFAGSLLLVLWTSKSSKVRRACMTLALAGGLAVVAALSVSVLSDSVGNRLEERSPVDFRISMYKAGWEMFLEKPILGWGSGEIQSELSRHVSDFHQDVFFFHNTYLEIAVEYGLVGLALYLWLIVELFRLSQKRVSDPQEKGLLDGGFRSLWPVLVIVYLVNASFVTMNYQFLSGLFFTLAGILAAQDRRMSASYASQD